MVYYFKASVDQSGNDEYSDFAIPDPSNTTQHTIYMGKDKFENDPLIKKSHPKNIWFHVDKHSSAHLYLQLSLEQQSLTFNDLKIDESLLIQIGQLTKANSIKANKLNNITIIYTPVDNLHTDGSMDVGTVTFKNPQKLKRIMINKKDNSIINKLNKTKTELSTDDFIKDQENLVKIWQSDKLKRERKYEQEQRNINQLYQDQKSKNKDPYADLMTEDNIRGSSNEFRNDNWVEDDFW